MKSYTSKYIVSMHGGNVLTITIIRVSWCYILCTCMISDKFHKGDSCMKSKQKLISKIFQ